MASMNLVEKQKRRAYAWRKELPLHIMMLPAIVFVLIFSYVPMAGILIAFQKFNPAKGFITNQEWAGFANFTYLFTLPNIWQVIWNTLYIAVMKIIANMIVPIIVALLINECTHKLFKRTVQTMIYFPYFISWIVLAGIFTDLLSPSQGIVNMFIKTLGIEPIYFLGDAAWFPYTMVLTDTWKSFGFGTVVYLAAITSIDPTLYEAAVIDGASRWKQTLHVTLPGMQMIIIMLMVLNLGNVLNAGFDQIFNMYSPQVYTTGDIIDTLVYRLGLLQSQFALSTAVGLFKSVVSCALISTSYYVAYRSFNYRIF